jgi:hypothetical protein
MLIVLIYALSLLDKLPFKLNIYNQCLNVDLVSPTYITSYRLTSHRPPDDKVCAGDTMRTGFIIESDRMSYGALIYKIQKRQSHESTEMNEDTSNAAQLLVVWRISESKKLYADVLLVKRDKILDKNDLRELHRKNFDRFRLCPDAATETWLLGDNTALMTTLNIMEKEHVLNITISEIEEDNGARMPARMNSER